MSLSGLILLGHGARDERWKQPMERIQALITEAQPGLRVELAFLDFLSPDLSGAVERLVGQGVHDIGVVPVFLGQGGHVREDLPRLLEAARQRFGQVRLSAKPAVGEDLGVLRAIAQYCAE
jgi:sirohydrochlorin cobaltochelatase